MDDFKEAGPCSLCGGTYEHWGHNPEPIKPVDERCCDNCNRTRVIPARLAMRGYSAAAEKAVMDSLKPKEG